VSCFRNLLDHALQTQGPCEVQNTSNISTIPFSYDPCRKPRSYYLEFTVYYIPGRELRVLSKLFPRLCLNEDFTVAVSELLALVCPPKVMVMIKGDLRASGIRKRWYAFKTLGGHRPSVPEGSQ